MYNEVIEDSWGKEDFEDIVSRALITCFESKPIKNKGAAPADRLTVERLNQLKTTGLYIPSNSRIFNASQLAELGNERAPSFDMLNDELPKIGCIAFKPDGKLSEGTPGSYMFMMHFRQVKSMGDYWHRRSSGVLYEVLAMFSMNEGGIDGDRRFITVDKQGMVTACYQRINSTSAYRGSPDDFAQTTEKELEELEGYGSIGLQALADKRFCWSITAQEKSAKAHLGCVKEEIKSLLYARDLPLSSTGRKRPILHLIEAHKRRLKNGIDIDVTPFLRGLQTVEINGTVFKVNPPAVIQSKVSLNSKLKYFGDEVK